MSNNENRILHRQKVRYWRYREWIEDELTLHSNGKFETADGELGEISYQHNASRPKFGNFDFVFVINTYKETECYSGPRFAVKDQQSCERWIQLVNLVHQRKKFEKIHSHPLSFIKNKGKFTCSICTSNNAAKDTFQWTCEFCNYFECSVCHDNINNGEHFFKSSSHAHLLMRIHHSDDKWLTADKRGSYKCKVCNKTTDLESYRYHCVECGDYDECPDCIAKQSAGGVAQSSDDLKINLGHLSHVLKMSESPDLANMNVDLGNLTKIIPTLNSEVYSLDMKECGIGRKYPKISHMSVITSKHWDLMNIEKVFPTTAYFEVTFFKKEGLLGIGICNQMHRHTQMLGHQQNSFGVLSDGTISYNHKDNAINAPGIKFTKNDVIGMGVMFDSFNQRRLFFTKNGQYIGCFDQTLHRGMDCFPGVSFAGDSKAIFSINFKGPFKFDLTSLANSLTLEKKDWLSSLPNELREKIGSFAPNDINAVTWRLVNKSMNTVMTSNTVWRELFVREWPSQNINLKMKSWMNFYKKRVHAFKAKTAAKMDYSDGGKKHGIENCDFEFECPMLWENLTGANLEHGQTSTERFCDKCQKSVYKVSDVSTARKYAEMGRCVSLIEPVKLQAARPMKMGRVAQPKRGLYNDVDPFAQSPETN